MPIYSFHCSDEECNEEIEHLISVKQYENEEYDKECLICKSELIRSISPLNFRLIGPTWHRDLYHSTFQKEHDDARKENDKHRNREDKVTKQMIKEGYL